MKTISSAPLWILLCLPLLGCSEKTPNVVQLKPLPEQRPDRQPGFEVDTDQKPLIEAQSKPEQQPETSQPDSSGFLKLDYSLAEKQAFVEQVLSAHGGRENFAKAKRGRSQQKVIGMPGFPPGTIAHLQEYFDLPQRFRSDAKAEVPGEELKFSYLINEVGSWKKTGRQNWQSNPREAKSTELKAFPSMNLDSLLTALDHPEESDVFSTASPEGKEMFVLRAQKQANWRGDTYIDAETHLLYGFHHPVYSALTQMVFAKFSDYRQVEGLMIPWKTEVYHNQKVVLETIVEQLELLPQLESIIFQQPGLLPSKP